MEEDQDDKNREKKINKNESMKKGTTTKFVLVTLGPLHGRC